MTNVLAWILRGRYGFRLPAHWKRRTICAIKTDGQLLWLETMFRSRRRTELIWLLAFLLPGVFGCSYVKNRRARAITRGNDLFAMHCGGCHSQRRLDLEKVPPDLHGVFDRAVLPSGRSATDDMVRSTIMTGRSGIMPSFEGSLSDEDIQDIILYLHTLKVPPRI